jgi:uncharacterized membrane protein
VAKKMSSASKKPRNIALDAARTVAIIMMMVHHTAFDMWYLKLTTIQLFEGGWYIWQKSTLILFLLLVGVSFALYSKKHNTATLWRKQWRRFTTLALAALAITVVTFIVIPQMPIYFGVLHCIAVSMLILPFVRTPVRTAIGCVIIAVLYVLSTHIHVQTNLLLPLNLYATFTTLDYVPLLPWLGVILLGNGIGYYIAPYATLSTQTTIWHYITWPGRHALLVYLIHQPIVLGILYVLYLA